MVTKRPSQKATHLPKDKLLPKVTMLFFDRPLATFLLWLALIVFGLASYTTLLKRAGFPSVNIPLNIVSGTYFVNDAAKVDHDVAQPLTEVALADSNVKSVQAQGADNFLTVQVQYKDGTDAQSAAKKLEQEVNDSHKLPANAHLQYFAPYFGATGGDTQQIDVAISFFDKNGTASTSDLAAKAQTAATWLQDKHLKDVKSIALKNPFETNADPETGQTATVQRTFDRFGQRDGTTNKFYNSVLIGIAAQKGTDVIKLDKRVRDALVELSSQPQFAGYDAQVSASFAPSIKDNLSELQRVLLEGLLAILVVGSIVIAIRASFITVVSMITVLLSALGFLYAIHYTLNVITLFALILGLALIVDDTIIMVEAIDSARKRSKNRREIVLQATRKISRAMLAATLTACLSFTPLLFVGGILGSFIRAIPITIIAALLISLLVALIFIPFFARFLLLGKKQLKKGVTEVSAGFEAALARSIAKPMEWARHSRAKLTSVIIIAICVGIGFVGAGGFIAKDVVFNIFPPTKDTNEVGLNLAFPPGTSIGQAETISANAEKLASQTLGDNFVRSSFNGTGDAQVANLQIEIISYSKRKVTSPQLVKQLQTAFDTQFKGAQVVAAQIDLGPPSSAFTVQIDASNREAAFKLANDMAAYLKGVELKRTSGKIAHMNNVSVSNPGSFLRTGHKAIITVSAGFDGDDTTTLVTLAQDAVKKEFPPDRVGSYGVPRDAISYDIGQESENQDSFKTLALAFPILLVVIFILLAIQFRSLLQPLLIFLAIPFSIFGVMLGLRLTNNAISFFTMLGFFALVGLSIKNTILLTDYANQARRQGMEPIDAAREALQERFRPLFATSMTAVVSLIPLALTSPFWQGLSVVLIFGLLSSTFLVVTVFPYYYLAAEYARLNIRAWRFLLWLVLTVAVAVMVGKAAGIGIGLAIVPLSVYLILLRSYFIRRVARRA